MQALYPIPASVKSTARKALERNPSAAPGARKMAESLATSDYASSSLLNRLAAYWKANPDGGPADQHHGGKAAAAWLSKARPVMLHRNPGYPGQAAHLLTDRALRYRARKTLEASDKPRQCAQCGSKRNLVADHKNGYEEDDRPANIQWLCKSCNTANGAAMAKAGKGRRTHQYNPAPKPASVPTYGQYMKAMDVLAGRDSSFSADAAKDILHRTPKSTRSSYNRQAWRTRRDRYGSSGRQGSFGFDDSAIPF